MKACHANFAHQMDPMGKKKPDVTIPGSVVGRDKARNILMMVKKKGEPIGQSPLNWIGFHI